MLRYLQLVNNSDRSVLQSQALADTRSVLIAGADQADRLIVDLTNPFSIPVTFDDSSVNHGDRLKVVGEGTTYPDLF